MPKCILALDQGTTSCRSAIIDEAGQILHIAQLEFPQHFPQPGWVEHDAREIWETQKSTIDQVLEKAQLSAADIAGIGITNQRETVVVWDRATGEPVGPAIVWQDRRTANRCDDLKNDGHETTIREKTGLILDAYFSATKAAWILDAHPSHREKAKAGELLFGTIDTWLIWNLTQGKKHVTDASNASRTMLFNLIEGKWDEELCDLLGVPSAMLPEVVDSSGICGWAEWDGIQIPIAGIAGDQQAALFGQQCFAPGMAKNTYGTGCFMLMNIGLKPTLSSEPLLTTVAWRIQGELTFALEGSVFIAGALIQWLRDEMKFVNDASEIEALANEVEGNGGVTVVPAFAGLGAPHWIPEARGTILGITRGTRQGHIARAALESIALQSQDVLISMLQSAHIPLEELRVDGGAAQNNLLMQYQADLLGLDVVRPQTHETTVLGAAYLAGLGIGMWPNTEALHNKWLGDRTFSPQQSVPWRSRQKQQWNRALRAVKAWALDSGTL